MAENYFEQCMDDLMKNYDYTQIDAFELIQIYDEVHHKYMLHNGELSLTQVRELITQMNKHPILPQTFMPSVRHFLEKTLHKLERKEIKERKIVK